MEPEARTPRKRRWLRRALIVVGVGFVLLLAVASVVPRWLSSDSGRAWLLGRVNESIPGRFTAAGIDLNWGGGQTVESLRLDDAAGNTVARVRLVSADVTLAQLLRGEYGTGRILIEGLEIDLVLDEQGRLNLAGAIAAPDDAEPEPVDLPGLLREFTLELPASLRLDIELRDARVSLQGPAIPKPLQLSDVAGTLRLERMGAPLEFNLDGTIDGGSHAKLTARLEGLDGDGRLRASDAALTLALEAEMEEGALRRLLGPDVHLGVDVRTSAEGAAFTVAARSSNLSVNAPGRVDVAYGEPARLHIEKDAHARYVVTPALLASFAAEDADVALANDVAVSLNVASLDAPLDGSGFTVNAKLAVADGRVDVRVAEVVESLKWTDWTASIQKQAAGDAASVKLHGRLDEGVVDVDGTLRLPADGQLRASVTSFPLARIDRVVESVTGRGGVLVDALGPTLDLEGRIENDAERRAKIDLRIDTQRLKLAAPLVVDFGRDLVQAKNVSVDYVVAPTLAPKLGLEQELPVRLDVASFSGKLSRFDPSATSMVATLKAGAARFGGDAPVELRGATAEVESESFAQGLRLNAECRLDDGRIAAAGDLAGLWDATGRMQLAKARGKMQVDIERLPVARFEPAVGELLSGRVTLDGDGSDARFDVRLRSDRMDLALPLSVSNGRARLRGPGQFRYTLTPDMAWRFLPAQRRGATIDQWTEARLEDPIEMTVNLRSVDMPARRSFHLDDARASGTLSLGPVRLADVPEAGRVVLSDWTVEFGGDSVADPSFVAKGAVESSRFAFGAPVRVDAKGDRDNLVLGLAAADRLTLDLVALRDGDSFRLRKPAALHVELRRDLLRQLDLPDAWLRRPLPVDAVFETMRMPADGDWRSADAAFRLTVPEARVHVEGRDVALSELELRGEVAAQITAQLSGKLGDGDLSARATLAERRRDAPLTLTARLRQIPTALLGETISACAGATADVELDVDFPDGRALLKAHTPHVDLDAQLERQGPWRLARPAKLTWTMTPEAFRVLLPDSEMRLAAPATLRIDIAKFALATDARSLTEASMKARAKVAEVRMRSRKGAELSVRALVLDVDAADLRKPMTIGVDANLGGAQPGSVRGTLVVEYLGDANKPIAFTQDQLAVRAKLDIDKLPVQPVDSLFDTGGYLTAVLGASASGACTARLSRGVGPIDIDLRSGNLQASVAGLLTRDSLRLRQPVQAKLTHSKALGDLVLPKLGPLFEGVVATEAPIRVVIADKGFRVPRPYKIAQVVAPHVMLDIGRVTMKNQSLVRVVKQLARSDMADQTAAWFTPAEISLRGGVIRYSRRLDLLMDRRYHFSTWGTADLERERLDMVLGVMPDTLNEILRIEGLGRADTLRIKVSGPLAKPRIDVGRAVADLAAIRAKDDALRNLPRLARPFAEAALQQLLKETFQGPPPLRATADPLPWDKEDDRLPPR
ncbi:MAG: hypothetical protein ACYTGZ_14945 [Planctomycetota bacterium]|jgi:hypothetical protein